MSKQSDEAFADKLLDLMYAEGPAGAAVMNKKGTILTQEGTICIASANTQFTMTSIAA